MSYKDLLWEVALLPICLLEMLWILNSSHMMQMLVLHILFTLYGLICLIKFANHHLLAWKLPLSLQTLIISGNALHSLSALDNMKIFM